jgi:hypothetical protein
MVHKVHGFSHIYVSSPLIARIRQKKELEISVLVVPCQIPELIEF